MQVVNRWYGIHVLVVIFGLCARGHKVYLNQWAVEVEGGKEEANRIAGEHGFINKGQVGCLEHTFLFEHRAIHKRSTTPSRHHHHKILRDPKVRWTEQQIAKKRVKRDYYHRPYRRRQRMSKKWDSLLNDDHWPKMWYLHNGARGGHDMNVLKAWERGYSGRGVVVTILDDGIEHSHPDLKPNYDPEASYDINNQDDDPMPRYSKIDDNRHGTRCAGEVAAVGNNSKCVVGVAYNAKIGGVRMLDGDVSDYVEASALGHNIQHIDIYSASWGPDDTGQIVDGPAKMAQDTFINGVLRGRKGKGSIYIWASGNGGVEMDSCACDGYANSIFTLSVSSVTQDNDKPWYLEECASTLATTYSSGENFYHKKMVSTDVLESCTDEFTGTSASAPIAAGVMALSLEANPELTWRDMQYLVVRTGNPRPFTDGEWTMNGVGRNVSLRYGYGLIDAYAMVLEAEKWIPVPQQRICASPVQRVSSPLNANGLLMIISVDGCSGVKAAAVNYLEHVQLKLSLKYSHRGDLAIYLTSPSGTRCKMLPRRDHDRLQGVFLDWPFMSVFFWGEKPQGNWTVEIKDEGDYKLNHGVIDHFQLVLYGTTEQPVNYRDVPRAPPSGGFNFTRVTPSAPPPSPTPTSQTPEMAGSGEVSEENTSVTTATKMAEMTSELPALTCDPMCDPKAGCTGPELEDCLACHHVRIQDTGLCAEECPLGTFQQHETDTCMACTPPCTACTSTGCTACPSPLLLLHGECLDSCPPTHYPVPSTGSCDECTSPCKRCQDTSVSCLECIHGYELDRHHGNQCVLVCADKQFKNSTSGECEDCDETCASCVGPESYMCTSCSGELLYQNSSCLNECVSDMFPESRAEGKVCVKCHPSCSSCLGPEPSNCTQCTAGLKLVQGECAETCPHGQYEASDSSCSNCVTNCSSCYSGDAYSCLSCHTDLLLQDGQCVENCSDGFFLQSASGMCVSCHGSCQTCTGPLLSNCSSCAESLYLTRGHCRTECAVDEYETDSGICGSCHTSCSSCHGPLHTDCSSCPSALVLLPGDQADGEGGTCEVDCPEGWYLGQGSRCRECDHSCATCTGANACSSCVSSLVLTHGQCVNETVSCSAGFYLNQELKACIACTPPCVQCWGAGPNSCLTCQPPSRLQTSTGQCLPCCSAPGYDWLVYSEGGLLCCDCQSNNSSDCMLVEKPVTVPASSTTLTPPQTHTDSTPVEGVTTTLTHLWSTQYDWTTLFSGYSTHPTLSTTPMLMTTNVSVARTTPTVSSRGYRIVTTYHAVTFLALGCVLSVCSFLLLFLLLQLRAPDGPCWRINDYQQVPLGPGISAHLHRAFSAPPTPPQVHFIQGQEDEDGYANISFSEADFPI